MQELEEEHTRNVRAAKQEIAQARVEIRKDMVGFQRDAAETALLVSENLRSQMQNAIGKMELTPKGQRDSVAVLMNTSPYLKPRGARIDEYQSPQPSYQDLSLASASGAPKSRAAPAASKSRSLAMTPPRNGGDSGASKGDKKEKKSS